VTGAALLDHASVQENIQHLRALTDLPLVIGFGIKDGESARAMAALADGVIIGSALVNEIKKLAGIDSVSQQELEATAVVIQDARKALDSIDWLEIRN
jgi:tryptophan synthase alpha chain